MGWVQVSFYNVQDLMEARKEVLPLARRNAQREDAVLGYDGFGQEQRAAAASRLEDFLDNIVEVDTAPLMLGAAIWPALVAQSTPQHRKFKQYT